MGFKINFILTVCFMDNEFLTVFVSGNSLAKMIMVATKMIAVLKSFMLVCISSLAFLISLERSAVSAERLFTFFYACLCCLCCF